MEKKTWIEISRNAFEDNIIEVKKRIKKSSLIIFVVKSNGYGLGLVEVVEATKNHVDWYGVDSLDEANRVRSVCGNPIIILGYVSPKDSLEVINKEYRLIAYQDELIEELAKNVSAKKVAKVHIKLDTGLVRLGLWENDLINFVKEINKYKHIEIEGFYTHLANIVTSGNKASYKKHIVEFESVLKKVKDLNENTPLLHVAESMGATLFKDLHYDAVRLGIVLYGFWGRKTQENEIQKMGVKLDLKPVFTWKTTIVNIKKVTKGDAIGYGHTITVKDERLVGILGIGFYDGLDKRYGSIGEVLINGKRTNILGKISMNMCVIDLSKFKNVKIGDEVIIIGRSGKEEITPYEVAQKINTSTYEVMTSINPLLPRLLI